MQTVKTFELNRKAWGMTLSRDGRRLYAFDRQSGSMTTIEALTGRELQVIRVGTTPTYAVEVP
jgi:hypothetical protein